MKLRRVKDPALVTSSVIIGSFGLMVLLGLVFGWTP